MLVDPRLSNTDGDEIKSLRIEDVTKNKFPVILISRADPEHCHVETLEKLDKSI